MGGIPVPLRLEVGKSFPSKRDLIFAIEYNAIRQRFQFKPEQSNKRYLLYKCDFMSLPQSEHSLSDSSATDPGPSSSGPLDVGESYASEGQPDAVSSAPKSFPAKCSKKKTCTWQISAGVDVDDKGFKIINYNPDHSCDCARPRFGLSRNKHLTASFVELQFKPMLQKLTAPTLVELVRELFEYDINDSIVYEAKKNDLGTPEDNYKYLECYVNLCRQADPGSKIELEKTPTNEFHRLFFSLGISRRGYPFSREMIFLDGCHLMREDNIVLLAATTLDGKGKLFQLGFALVPTEDFASWDFFLRNLRDALNLQDQNPLFMSDRQKGLIAAVKAVFPGSPHGCCYNHLMANLQVSQVSRDKNSDFAVVKKLVDAAAFATTLENHAVAFEKVRAQFPAVHDWLKAAGPENWAKYAHVHRRFGHITSNPAESTNSWIKPIRKLTIRSIIEGYQNLIRDSLEERRTQAWELEGTLLPLIEEEITRSSSFASSFSVFSALTSRESTWTSSTLSEPSDASAISPPELSDVFKKKGTVFNVEHHLYGKQRVDFGSKTCSCGDWQDQQYPCVHVCACCNFLQVDMKLFVHRSFLVANYKKMYGSAAVNVVGKCSAKQATTLFPPLYVKHSGRPRTNGRRECNMDKRHNTSTDNSSGKKGPACSVCGQSGHNKATCDRRFNQNSHEHVLSTNGQSNAKIGEFEPDHTNEPPAKKRKGKCTNCHKEGHYRPTCPLLKVGTSLAVSSGSHESVSIQEQQIDD